MTNPPAVNGHAVSASSGVADYSALLNHLIDHEVVDQHKRDARIIIDVLRSQGQSDEEIWHTLCQARNSLGGVSRPPLTSHNAKMGNSLVNGTANGVEKGNNASAAARRSIPGTATASGAAVPSRDIQRPTPEQSLHSLVAAASEARAASAGSSNGINGSTSFRSAPTHAGSSASQPPTDKSHDLRAPPTQAPGSPGISVSRLPHADAPRTSMAVASLDRSSQSIAPSSHSEGSEGPAVRHISPNRPPPPHGRAFEVTVQPVRSSQVSRALPPPPQLPRPLPGRPMAGSPGVRSMDTSPAREADPAFTKTSSSTPSVIGNVSSTMEVSSSMMHSKPAPVIPPASTGSQGLRSMSPVKTSRAIRTTESEELAAEQRRIEAELEQAKKEQEARRESRERVKQAREEARAAAQELERLRVVERRNREAQQALEDAEADWQRAEQEIERHEAELRIKQQELEQRKQGFDSLKQGVKRKTTATPTPVDVDAMVTAPSGAVTSSEALRSPQDPEGRDATKKRKVDDGERSVLRPQSFQPVNTEMMGDDDDDEVGYVSRGPIKISLRSSQRSALQGTPLPVRAPVLPPPSQPVVQSAVGRPSQPVSAQPGTTSQPMSVSSSQAPSPSHAVQTSSSSPDAVRRAEQAASQKKREAEVRASIARDAERKRAMEAEAALDYRKRAMDAEAAAAVERKRAMEAHAAAQRKGAMEAEAAAAEKQRVMKASAAILEKKVMTEQAATAEMKKGLIETQAAAAKASAVPSSSTPVPSRITTKTPQLIAQPFVIPDEDGSSIPRSHIAESISPYTPVIDGRRQSSAKTANIYQSLSASVTQNRKKRESIASAGLPASPMKISEPIVIDDDEPSPSRSTTGNGAPHAAPITYNVPKWQSEVSTALQRIVSLNTFQQRSEQSGDRKPSGAGSIAPEQLKVDKTATPGLNVKDLARSVQEAKEHALRAEATRKATEAQQRERQAEEVRKAADERRKQQEDEARKIRELLERQKREIAERKEREAKEALEREEEARRRAEAEKEEQRKREEARKKRQEEERKKEEAELKRRLAIVNKQREEALERQRREEQAKIQREEEERQARLKKEKEEAARKEAERIERDTRQREESERKLREQKLKEEAALKEREEAERKAQELRQREEAECKLREEAEMREREARLLAEEAIRKAQKAQEALRQETERKLREQQQKQEAELRRQEREEKERKEREKLAREEAERKWREEQQKLELQKQEREEGERKEREKLAREEAECQARELRERQEAEEAKRLAREEAERKARPDAAMKKAQEEETRRRVKADQQRVQEEEARRREGEAREAQKREEATRIEREKAEAAARKREQDEIKKLELQEALRRNRDADAARKPPHDQARKEAERMRANLLRQSTKSQSASPALAPVPAPAQSRTMAEPERLALELRQKLLVKKASKSGTPVTSPSKDAKDSGANASQVDAELNAILQRVNAPRRYKLRDDLEDGEIPDSSNASAKGQDSAEHSPTHSPMISRAVLKVSSNSAGKKPAFQSSLRTNAPGPSSKLHSAASSPERIVTGKPDAQDEPAVKNESNPSTPLTHAVQTPAKQEMGSAEENNQAVVRFATTVDAPRVPYPPMVNHPLVPFGHFGAPVHHSQSMPLGLDPAGLQQLLNVVPLESRQTFLATLHQEHIRTVARQAEERARQQWDQMYGHLFSGSTSSTAQQPGQPPMSGASSPPTDVPTMPTASIGGRPTFQPAGNPNGPSAPLTNTGGVQGSALGSHSMLPAPVVPGSMGGMAGIPANAVLGGGGFSAAPPLQFNPPWAPPPPHHQAWPAHMMATPAHAKHPDTRSGVFTFSPMSQVDSPLLANANATTSAQAYSPAFGNHAVSSNQGNGEPGFSPAESVSGTATAAPRNVVGEDPDVIAGIAGRLKFVKQHAGQKKTEGQ
ncbi:uncharacterized protein EV422DRAFT_533454 [Fimicolochytrium jonesii]|uniref:uncharacterized protein n=1 Tax=Fimicolochytrium jonesii TaxID=1396493 RepID=UPI0022FE8676|nr:uncharacterized protein EV422DRAFT_533454 [Fimicolochytrium jonesii]KAI8819557.1 hypothetical protein EV422DRAFT_533454 [Fimicolochytrium jonesii]